MAGVPYEILLDHLARPSLGPDSQLILKLTHSPRNCLGMEGILIGE